MVTRPFVRRCLIVNQRLPTEHVRVTSVSMHPPLQRIPAYQSLDLFRGLAALWVVMCHSCVPWLTNKHTAYFSNPLYAFSARGQLGVVLFFVISGYCITAAVYSALHSGKTVTRYFFDRLRRIYPPYLFALLLTVGANLVIGSAESHHLIGHVHHDIAVGRSPIYWAGNILLLQYELHTSFTNIVFWSLCYEVTFYVFMGLFLLAAKQVAKVKDAPAGAMVVVLALGASSIASLSYLIVAGKEIFPFDLWPLFALGGLLFFTIEMKPSTMKGYTEARRVIWSTSGLVCVFTGLYAALRVLGGTDVVHPSSRIRAITALLFCAALAWLRKYDQYIVKFSVIRPLFLVGSVSYSLYLIHPVVLPFVDVVLRKRGLDGNQYVITFITQIVVAVIAGYLMFVGVEQFFISKRQSRRFSSEQLASKHPSYALKAGVDPGESRA